jgi:ABC-type spermidine/putrescine transport system permease subunit II
MSRARPSVSLLLFAGLVLAFLMVHVLVIVPMSFSASKFLEFPPRALSLRWYAAYWQTASWTESTLLSVKVAALTVLAATPIGTMTALVLVRGRIPGKRLLHALIVAPLIVPAIVLAIATYGVYAKLRLIGTTAGLVLAQTVLHLPYVVLIVSAALTRFDRSLELAAMNLGASRLAALGRVTFPLISPAILSAAVLTFILSFDELVVSMFLLGTRRHTLPVQMFAELNFSLTPVIAAVSSLLVVLAVAAVLCWSLLSRDTPTGA